MRVAVLGLGRMGHAVAEGLSGRHDLVLWNRTREKASEDMVAVAQIYR